MVSISSYTLTSPMADEHRRLASKVAVIDTTTSRTITAADHGKRIWFTNASTINVTVPSGLPIWFECELAQDGTGQVVVAAGAGATVSAYSGWLKTAGKGAGGVLAAKQQGVFRLFGQPTA